MLNRWLAGDLFISCSDCTKQKECNRKEEFRPEFLSKIAAGDKPPVCKEFKLQRYEKVTENGKCKLVKV